MKQAIYRKNSQSLRGRAWEIQMLGDAVPAIEETVEVLTKNGTKDHVWVTEVSHRNGGVFCSFRTKQRDVGNTSVQVAPPLNVSDFLDNSTPQEQPQQVPVKAPQWPQAPQAPAIPLELAVVQQSVRVMLQRLMTSEGNAQAHARAASDAAGEATKVAKQLPTLIPELVKAQLESMRPIVIKVGEKGPEIKLEERTHPLFEKVLRLAQAGINVLLVGEAGCGKSYLAHQIAKALGLAFGTLHCTAGMSESQISGWLLPVGKTPDTMNNPMSFRELMLSLIAAVRGSGKFEYFPADFVTKYSQGNSLFLLDEIDAADPNVLMFMNGALANGALHIPHRLQGPEVHRGERAIIMAAANTFGHGANAKYQGRNALDGATLDRFYVVEMDYDSAREFSMFGKAATNPLWKAAEAPTSAELEALGLWVLALRDKARRANLRRIVSSRTLQKALDARKAGIPTDEVKRDSLSGWTQDELNKVGETR